jgi:hypothetical protein
MSEELVAVDLHLSLNRYPNRFLPLLDHLRGQETLLAMSVRLRGNTCWSS